MPTSQSESDPSFEADTWDEPEIRIQEESVYFLLTWKARIDGKMYGRVFHILKSDVPKLTDLYDKLITSFNTTKRAIQNHA